MFVPLNKGALELSPGLEVWIVGTLPRKAGWEVLDPEGWFERGFEEGHFIWAPPPPSIADSVLELACESVLIRPWNSHAVFVCPALMTS
jgi:hypothetical protein